MYPKNAVTPERIAIGPVVQISDGAVQTSGCAVRIIPSGGAEADGAGTTAYSTDGVILYTPTQAETNYASFILIAKKTGCIPSAVTVVPSLSSTPGQVVCADNQKVDVNTIKTQSVTCAAGVTVRANVGTAAESTAQTGDAYDRLGAPAGASVSADVAAVKADSAAILTDTGTTLDTLIKDIPTVAEFNARTIPAADYLVASDTLARVTLVDTCATNTDMRGTDGAALATVCTEGRLAELDAANLPADVAAVKSDSAAILVDTGTTLPGTMTTIAGYLDTEIAAILADTNELQTDLANGGRVDLLIDGIKAKTDKMTYTSGDDLDVNVQKINDVTLTGNGSTTPIGAV